MLQEQIPGPHPDLLSQNFHGGARSGGGGKVLISLCEQKLENGVLEPSEDNGWLKLKCST